MQKIVFIFLILAIASNAKEQTKRPEVGAKHHCNIQQANYRDCMFDKIKEYDGDKGDYVAMIGINYGHTKSIMFGTTTVIDKRNIIEIPVDPRAWIVDEMYIEHPMEIARSALMYVDKIPTKVPEAPESGLSRAYHRRGDNIMHRVYAVRTATKQACDIMHHPAVRNFEKTEGVTLLVDASHGPCEAAHAKYILLKGGVKEISQPWLESELAEVHDPTSQTSGQFFH